LAASIKLSQFLDFSPKISGLFSITSPNLNTSPFFLKYFRYTVWTTKTLAHVLRGYPKLFPQKPDSNQPADLEYAGIFL